MYNDIKRCLRILDSPKPCQHSFSSNVLLFAKHMAKTLYLIVGLFDLSYYDWG